MKEKSAKLLAARCREKLRDPSWDYLLAARVQNAYTRQNRKKLVWLSASVILIAGFITLSAWSFNEAQGQADLMAMIDEVAYPVFGSVFAE